MSRHFTRERELQRSIELTLAESLPQIEVLEVELDDPQELVRVFIDHADGVGLPECEAVTHAIRDTCPDHALEVSSPGVDRPMRSAAQFRAHLGATVRIRRAGVHRAANVEVVDVDDSSGVTIRTGAGDSIVVPFDEVVRCRLVEGHRSTTANTRSGNRKERA